VGTANVCLREYGSISGSGLVWSGLRLDLGLGLDNNDNVVMIACDASVIGRVYHIFLDNI
jgi:hypothetical protein